MSGQPMVVGAVLPELAVQFTRETLVRYAGASGDFNPIHYSDRAATAIGLPGVLAHGMLTCSVALRVVTDWLGGSSRVRRYATRFAKPIFVPDDGVGATVCCSGVVTAVADGVAQVTLTVTAGGAKVLGATIVEVDCA